MQNPKRELKKEQAKEVRRIKCNNCSSSFGYPRLKKEEWVCRSCGHIQKMEIEKDAKP